MLDNFWFLEPFRIPEDPLIAEIYLRSFRDRKASLLRCGVTEKEYEARMKEAYFSITTSCLKQIRSLKDSSSFNYLLDSFFENLEKSDKDISECGITKEELEELRRENEKLGKDFPSLTKIENEDDDDIDEEFS